MTHFAEAGYLAMGVVFALLIALVFPWDGTSSQL